jgi:two-component system sensor histidine kinase SenX3
LTRFDEVGGIYDRRVNWVVITALAGGLLVGLVVGVGIATARRRDPAGTPTGPVTDGSAGPAAPVGLGRRSLDALRVGVVVLDPDDEAVLINPAIRAMGLLRAGALPGTVGVHPVIRTLAREVRRTGVRREREMDLPRGPEGEAQEPFGVRLRAIGLGAGYVVIEAADVTEAHRVARVRRDFVANVSHELKTPIGALQLLAEALLDATGTADGGDVVAARRFAERIQHESTRLGKLVNELLELSRLQGAAPLPTPEPVAVDWILAEVIDRTRTAASARGVTVVVEGEPELTVYGDGAQLATAVTNLVENAIAYSGPGTRVTIDVRRADASTLISVTDQGIGIAPNEVDRVFERFYRTDQARSRSTGGTGLGLAIVKHIVTNHGGRVEVSSTLGGGSTFAVRLPEQQPGESTTGEVSPPRSTLRPEGPTGPDERKNN